MTKLKRCGVMGLFTATAICCVTAHGDQLESGRDKTRGVGGPAAGPVVMADVAHAASPDTHVVTYDFGDSMLVFESRNWHRRGFEGAQVANIAFYGDGGSLIIRGTTYTIYDMHNRKIDEGSDRAGEVDHIPNFLDGIRKGTPLNAEIEIAYKSTLLCHLGAIAHRTGHTLHCDPTTGHILNDPEAEALWSRKYEPGWEPKV